MLLSTIRGSAPGLVLLLLSSSALVADALTPAKSSCVRTRSRQLAFGAACGHEGSQTYCLANLPEVFLQSDVETCFLESGCTADEAAVEAVWALRRCESPDELGSNNGNNELRRRQKKATETTAETAGTTAADQTPTATAKNPKATATAKAATTAPAATTTQQAAQTTTEADQSSSSSDDSVVVVTETDSAVTALAATTDTTTPLTCIITTTVETTVCPVISTGPNKGRVGSCTPTLVSYPTCSPGLYCSTDSQGNPTCMRFRNQLDTSGIIVAIFFATAITAAVVLIVSLCCRDRARAREAARRAAASAALGAQQAAAGKRPGFVGARSVSAQSADRAPLMAPPRGYGPVETEQHEQDPFHDRHGN